VTPSPWLLAAGDIGVIDMAFLSIIRRWALRERLSIREIARRTSLSHIEAIGRHSLPGSGLFANRERGFKTNG
jgi:hypothetical protein